MPLQAAQGQRGRGSYKDKHGQAEWQCIRTKHQILPIAETIKKHMVCMYYSLQFQRQKREEDPQSLNKDKSASIPPNTWGYSTAMQKLGNILKKNQHDKDPCPCEVYFLADVNHKS